jgi:hypothetical protein
MMEQIFTMKMTLQSLQLVFGGHLDIVRCLLDKGLDVNTNDGFMINYSSALGYLNMVELLLKSGSKIYDASDKGTGIVIGSIRKIVLLFLSMKEKPSYS